MHAAVRRHAFNLGRRARDGDRGLARDAIVTDPALYGLDNSLEHIIHAAQ